MYQWFAYVSVITELLCVKCHHAELSFSAADIDSVTLFVYLNISTGTLLFSCSSYFHLYWCIVFIFIVFLYFLLLFYVYLLYDSHDK